MKSTPGPWMAYEIDDRQEIGVMTKDETVICRSFESTPNAAANAHLVASAPDLLRAIENAYLKIATVAENFPIDAAPLAAPLEDVINELETVLFRAKRAEGQSLPSASPKI